MKVAVIGGGAAGFFAAINCKVNHPEALVIIYEKSSKTLSKVKVSGGGRCNVTNGTTSISELCSAYPRGGKQLKKIFHRFGTQDTRNWFESRGVKLYAQDDSRVFPVSDDSQTIIDCFHKEIQQLGIKLALNTSVDLIEPLENGISLERNGQRNKFDKVIVTTGGSPKPEGFNWLKDLGHKIESPVPSLFTFNMAANPVSKLMGVAAQEVAVRIQGTKLKSEGPLLITHWGMSGPAILKLSSIGARELADLNYHFSVQINWSGVQNFDQVRDQLSQSISANPKKDISKLNVLKLPERLWLFLLSKAEIDNSKKSGDLGKNTINKLSEILSNDVYEVKGKTTFKEEFVTCGGISLSSVDLNTMQSKVVPNLYFAGEILDIDAITGGYNFQNAWSTAFIAAELK